MNTKALFGADNSCENELILSARQGDDASVQELLLSYSPAVKAWVQRLAPPDEVEDFFQEGMFALYTAVDDFNFSSPFQAFAKLCVERRLISLLRRKNRKSTVPEDKVVQLSEMLSSPLQSPEEQLISREAYDRLMQTIKAELSAFEYSVLCAYLESGSIMETVSSIGRDKKTVNNALFRIRTKLKNSV